jgi:hypothetical protein
LERLRGENAGLRRPSSSETSEPRSVHTHGEWKEPEVESWGKLHFGVSELNFNQEGGAAIWKDPVYDNVEEP